jgi:dipeptidyl aminopeptidase/acylaminoacyl peptidase
LVTLKSVLLRKPRDKSANGDMQISKLRTEVLRAEPSPKEVRLSIMQLSMSCLRSYLLLGLIISSKNVVIAQAVTSGKPFSYADLQRLTSLSDVKISPDARAIVYSTHPIDIKHDGYEQTSWIVRLNHTKALVTLPRVDEPSWSPDGRSLAVVSYSSNKSTVQLLSSDTLKVLQSFEVPNRPGSLTWSPDSKLLAFALVVPEATSQSFLEQAVDQAEEQLERPQNAEWAAAVQITQAAHYREDGGGWLKQAAGHHHIFVLSIKDGILRRVGREPFNDDEPAWSADSRFLFFASDRRPGWKSLYPVTSIYRTDMAGHVTRLTQGSDFFSEPKPSLDGKWIAYMRTPDREANYTQSKLYIMHLDGTQAHQLAVDLDRDLSSISWADDSQGVYAKYTDHGIGHVGLFSVDGHSKVLASGINGNFSVSRDGTIAYSGGRADRPNELMLLARGKSAETLTSLNPFLQQRQLGKLVHLVANSSGSSVPIEGWALLPPGSTGKEKLPMILVLHGGPFGDDGPTWDSERELFAAAGYAVVYGNYLGSTSYGAAFSEPANTAFPGVAYDSAMSLVDEGIRQGFVNPDRLFVTGSSAGAALTTWITGKTHRFQAAAAEKPPIDQMSEALTSDQYLADFLVYGGAPWLHEKELWANSPLSLAGSVTTPTLFIVGEEDFRTPVEQSLLMYDALQLRGIPTALLRAPGASHGSLRSRPSQQTAAIAATLAWFQEYDDQRAARTPGARSTP